MVLQEIHNYEGENFITTYFRFYRCILICRIFRLCQHLEYMSFIVDVIWKSFGLFFNLAFLFSLVLIFFSLLGREFFRNYFSNESFNTFSTSFISVFQIITLDNWYNFLTDERFSLDQVIYLAIYIICLIFIGTYFFLNLFLTIIIDIFQSKQEQKDEEEQEEKKQEVVSTKRTLTKSADKRRKAIISRTPKLDLEINSAIKSIQMMKKTTNFFSFREEIHEDEEDEDSNGSLRSLELSEPEIQEAKDKIKCLEKFVNKLESQELKTSENYSLFLISPDNLLRKYLKIIVENFYFKLMIRLLIWCHMILQGIDTLFIERSFYYTNQTYEVVSVNMELIIFIVFTFEIIMKIYVYGLIIGPNTFLQKFSNIFTLILVLAYYMQRKTTQTNLISYVSFFIKFNYI